MIRNYLRRIFTFVKDHKNFTLFIVFSLLLNMFLLLHRKNEKTEYITCSTFDKGVLGTYGLYRDLEERSVPVRRIKLPVFKEINREHDRGKTLVIISPLFTPQQWEWNNILDWVADGNRLITTGVLGPKTNGWLPNFTASVSTSNVAEAETSVLLPVDTAFPYSEPLPKLSPIQRMAVFGKLYKDRDSVRIKHFLRFSPDEVPFLAHANKPTAVKKVVGNGEWIAFTDINPFSNSVLRDPAWYRFATRFFTGDDAFEGKPIMFDEFHNGYRATKDLWQLLTYYRFDSGIVYLSVLVLLYLFLTGIRIIPPVGEREHLHRDAIPGIQALANLLLRYGAWKGLLKREAAAIYAAIAGREVRDRPDYGYMVERYSAKRPLPPGVDSKERLSDIFATVENRADDLDKTAAIKIFNLFMFMRKELNP